jgi:hypothetical protein
MPCSVISMPSGVSRQRFHWRGVCQITRRPQPCAKQREPLSRLWNQQ